MYWSCTFHYCTDAPVLFLQQGRAQSLVRCGLLRLLCSDDVFVMFYLYIFQKKLYIKKLRKIRKKKRETKRERGGGGNKNVTKHLFRRRHPWIDLLLRKKKAVVLQRGERQICLWAWHIICKIVLKQYKTQKKVFFFTQSLFLVFFFLSSCGQLRLDLAPLDELVVVVSVGCVVSSWDFRDDEQRSSTLLQHFFLRVAKP